MSQSPSIDQIISMGRADFSAKQQIMYDEIIKPYIQIISNLAKKLELQKENTLLKSEKKVMVAKTKKKKKNN